MRILMLGAAIALLAAGGAAAQTRTAQFAVRAQVTADCQITAEDLNFGAYKSDSIATGSTPVTLRCTPGSSATVSFDAGASGNPQARYMDGPGHLNYQIYKDIGRQDPIDTMGAAFQLPGISNIGQLVTYRVYGEVPVGQNVPAGNYVDILRVTVQY
ncbi:Csu type fimbrial protein [Brevundimonas sp.]|uniref:Csu type fimbrial protein n=1 Tax=Brevundimonas sp. TaxID=1871086 RepID=UPI002FC603B7